MIRKSGVVVVLIFIILVILFNLFFLNIIIKSSLIKTGEAIFKAKTEIKKVNANVFTGKILIQNISVGDKNKEFKNLFEIDKINLQVKIPQLFNKKIIIDAVEVENFALSTDRKESGFLPPKKIKRIEKQEKEKKPGLLDKLASKVEEKAKQEIKKMPISKLTGIKNIKNINIKDKIKLENLESINKINEAKQNIEIKKQNIKLSIENLNIDKRADTVKNKAEKLKDFKLNSAQDIPEAQKKLQELEEIKRELNSLNNDINNTKNQITDFASYTNNELKEINLVKERDIDNVMKSINLNILNAGELEKAILGPVWYERVKTVLNLFTLAQKYIPAGGKKDKNDKKKTLEQKREKGTLVVFVKEKSLPNFWIKKINLSVNKSNDNFFIKGSINDICTEQAIIEKSLIFSLIAEKGKHTYSLKGKIDHIENINDFIEIKAENLEPKISGIESVDLGNVKMKIGSNSFELLGKNTDDKISITGTMNLNNITYEKKEEDITYQVLSGIDRIKILLNISFKDDAGISISSDLLEKIRKSIDKIYGKKIAEIKAKINSEIEKQIKSKMKELQDVIAKDNKELAGILNTDMNKVKSVEGYIDSIKGNIEKQIKDSQSKVLEEKKKDIMKMFK